MSNPHVLAGHCRQSDGTTAQENAVVYVYNKTLDEEHNGFDTTKFVELKTNAQGEWQVNLANFTGDWSVGDIIWISAFYEDTAQVRRHVVTASPKNDLDLTLRDLEPKIAIQNLLKIYVTDPNTTRANTSLLFKPKYSANELTKDNYPIVSIRTLSEESESAGIFNTNAAEERTSPLLLTIHIWAKQGEKQAFTIAGVSYEGTKLRDYLARQISEALRKQFYKKPRYDQNAIIQKFHSYTKTRMEDEDFKDDGDDGIIKKGIEIEVKSIVQTS